MGVAPTPDLLIPEVPKLLGSLTPGQEPSVCSQFPEASFLDRKATES